MSAAKESDKSSRLVIVAVHDRAHRDNICDFLSEAGFRVVSSATCQVALNACRAAVTDPVLVAEIRLPDMWGLDLARAATQFHFKTCVICISEKELRRECQEEMNERGWIWLNTYSPDNIVKAIRDFPTTAPTRHKPSQAFPAISVTSSQTRNCG